MADGFVTGWTETVACNQDIVVIVRVKGLVQRRRRLILLYFYMTGTNSRRHLVVWRYNSSGCLTALNCRAGIDSIAYSKLRICKTSLHCWNLCILKWITFTICTFPLIFVCRAVNFCIHAPLTVSWHIAVICTIFQLWFAITDFCLQQKRFQYWSSLVTQKGPWRNGSAYSPTVFYTGWSWIIIPVNVSSLHHCVIKILCGSCSQLRYNSCRKKLYDPLVHLILLIIV